MAKRRCTGRHEATSQQTLSSQTTPLAANWTGVLLSTGPLQIVAHVFLAKWPDVGMGVQPG